MEYAILMFGFCTIGFLVGFFVCYVIVRASMNEIMKNKEMFIKKDNKWHPYNPFRNGEAK